MHQGSPFCQPERSAWRIIAVFWLVATGSWSCRLPPEHEALAPALALAMPERLAPGTISTEIIDLSGSVAPDGTLYFTVGGFAFDLTIAAARPHHGGWARPELAPFARAGAFDADPFVSLDGCRVFFVSDRPRPQTPDEPRTVQEIWLAERGSAGGWTSPRPLGAPIHSSPEGGGEWHPSESAAGVLYFSSQRASAPSQDLYRARPAGAAGRYHEPERLPASINRDDAFDTDPWIAPAEDMLIFASDRDGSFDLFATERSADGGWLPPVPLPERINSDGAEFGAHVDPAGRYFYFSSNRGGFRRPPATRLGYSELRARLRGASNGWHDIYRVPWAALRADLKRALRQGARS